MKVVDALAKASKVEDIAAPFVWTVGIDVDHKEIVQIKNLTKKKKVWVEILNGTDNFIKNYNDRKTISIKSSDKTLIASEWYRKLLGLDKNQINKIEIKHSKFPLFIKTFLAAKSHPDTNVRLATYLAILSVILGVIGAVPVITGLVMSSENENKNNYFIYEPAGNRTTVEAVKYIASVSGFKSGDYHLPEYDWSVIENAINSEDALFIIASGFTDPQKVKVGNSCDNECLANKRAVEVNKKLNSLLISPKPIFNMENGLDEGVKLVDTQVSKYSTERKVKIYIGMKQA
ncbi:hypothetical protein [Photobacterium kagoshimensis]|uniref:hypothetical protein n=1 Tax=Photobacterium kagoshimensis TaxID=2910242 RepID=UPI003D13FEDF